MARGHRFPRFQGRAPFDHNNYSLLIFSMFQSTFPMWTKYNLEEVMKKSVDSMALNLLDQMLIYDPR